MAGEDLLTQGVKHHHLETEQVTEQNAARVLQLTKHAHLQPGTPVVRVPAAKK